MSISHVEQENKKWNKPSLYCSTSNILFHLHIPISVLCLSCLALFITTTSFLFFVTLLPLTSQYNDILEWFQSMEVLSGGLFLNSVLVLTPTVSHLHSLPTLKLPSPRECLEFTGSAFTLKHHLSICLDNILTVVSFQQHYNTVYVCCPMFVISFLTSHCFEGQFLRYRCFDADGLT